MISVWKQYLSFCIIVIVLFGRGDAQDKRATTVVKDGTLIFDVTLGDLGNAPANDVYVEAHGYDEIKHTPASYVLKLVRPGHYETSIPPGIYDVFVSESDSVPRCKRVLIRSQKPTYWIIKLEDDDIYLTK